LDRAFTPSVRSRQLCASLPTRGVLAAVHG
jgi:hypothetical protein